MKIYQMIRKNNKQFIVKSNLEMLVIKKLLYSFHAILNIETIHELEENEILESDIDYVFIRN